MANKFKVGDVIRIKDSFVVGNSYGDIIFISTMAPFSGSIRRIIYADCDGSYHLQFSSEETKKLPYLPNLWWSDEMLESVDNKFAVGDVITIRKDIVAEDYYDGFFFNPRMYPHRGCKAIITKCDNEFYNLDIDNGNWNWPASMFVETTQSKKQSITENNYENQLQREESPLNRGSECTGTGICYPGEQATVVIGHLGYRKVSCGCQAGT